MFQLPADVIPDPVLVLDRQLRFVHANGAACSLVGLDAPALQGRAVGEFLHPGDSGQFLRELERWVSGRGGEGPLFCRMARADGGWEALELRPGRIQAADGEAELALLARTLGPARQAELQELLVELSTTYIDPPPGELDSLLVASMEKLGRFIGADRFYIFRYDFGRGTCSNTHEWVADGVEPQIDSLQDYPLDGLEVSWVDRHRRGEAVRIKDVHCLEQGDGMRRVLEPQGIRGIISVPLMDDGSCVGFVGLDFLDVYRPAEAEERLLTVFARMLTNARKRHAMLAELASSRGFLLDLVENSGSMIAVKDLEGRYELVNRRWEETMGLRRIDVLGRTDGELFPGAVARQFVANDRRVIEQGDVLEAEEILDEPGARRYLHAMKFPTRGRAGEVRGLCAMMTDITTRKETELALRESSARYRSIVETTSEGIWVIDAAGNTSFVNQRMADMVGCTVEEMDHKAFLDFVADDPETVLDTVIHTPGHARGDLRLRCADGSMLWVTVKSSPMGRAAGPDGSRLMMISDISDRKRAERERVNRVAAEQASRAKTAFLSTMSHEMRTPLNAVIGFSQVLEREEALGERQRGHLRTIIRSGEYLLSLINDVLEFSRLEASTLQLTPGDVCIRTSLEELLRIFEPRAKGKGLAFRASYADDLPEYLHVDEGKLRQVLINLVDNAIKFTDEGEIRIEVEASMPRPAAGDGPAKVNMVLRVSDSGRGIPYGDMEHLFEAFFQGERGHAAGGAGLGLAIARQLAETMGGEISASSVPGEGAQFCVSIPAGVAASGTSAGEGIGWHVVGLDPVSRPCRILVAGGDEENRELLSGLLLPVGFEVRGAPDHAVALGMIREWRPHAVLMPIGLPGGDLAGLLADFHEQVEPPAKVAFIAIAPACPDAASRTVHAAGFDVCLPGPLRVESLFEALQSQLGLSYLYAAGRERREIFLPLVHQEAMRHLPATVRQEMRQLLEEGDMSGLISLIHELDPVHAELGNALENLARQFDYERLDRLL